MPLLTVRHVTTYRYKQPVAFGEHRGMFRPRDSYDQRLLGAELRITPEPHSLHWMHDVFGNCVVVARFARRASELCFDSTIRLDHAPAAHALDFPIAEHALRYPFSYDQQDMPDLLRSIERQYPDPANDLSRWARQFLGAGQHAVPTFELLSSVARAIKRDFTYVARAEMGIQEPLQTLKLRSGSCRDLALLMIEAVRSLGFAARFVSGYLYVPARGRALGGGSTHAWVQVYVPGAGWMEFDPTNGILGSRDLIRVAVARDPRQAVPLHGTWIGFPSDHLGMSVEVTVADETDRAGAAADAAPGEPVAQRRPHP